MQSALLTAEGLRLRFLFCFVFCLLFYLHAWLLNRGVVVLPKPALFSNCARRVRVTKFYCHETDLVYSPPLYLFGLKAAVGVLRE